MGSPLITPELVALDLTSDDRETVTRQLIDLLAAFVRSVKAGDSFKVAI